MLYFTVLIGLASTFKFDPTSLAAYFQEELGEDVGDYFEENVDGPQLTAAFSSCKQTDLTKHNSKSFSAILNCQNEDESVDHLSECSWQCDTGVTFLKLGADKTNSVTCRDGQWRGLKRAVCVERCTWKSLRQLQVNGEFSHCRTDDNLGEAKYICKVTSADPQNGIRRNKRARCSCSSSRQSGKCSWVEKGVD